MDEQKHPCDPCNPNITTAYKDFFSSAPIKKIWCCNNDPDMGRVFLLCRYNTLCIHMFHWSLQKHVVVKSIQNIVRHLYRPDTVVHRAPIIAPQCKLLFFSRFSCTNFHLTNPFWVQTDLLSQPKIERCSELKAGTTASREVVFCCAQFAIWLVLKEMG